MSYVSSSQSQKDFHVGTFVEDYFASFFFHVKKLQSLILTKYPISGSKNVCVCVCVCV